MTSQAVLVYIKKSSSAEDFDHLVKTVQTVHIRGRWHFELLEDRKIFILRKS